MTKVKANSGGRRARRGWSVAEKQRIVDEISVAGATVSGVARRHDISPSQLFAWRREVGRGVLRRIKALVAVRRLRRLSLYLRRTILYLRRTMQIHRWPPVGWRLCWRAADCIWRRAIHHLG
jgi:transposase-like protein